MKYINVKRAKALTEKKDVELIDVRSPVSYRDHTIPGARNIPLRNVSMLMGINRKKPLILFGHPDDNDVKTMAQYAEQLQFEQVYVLPDYTEWFNEEENVDS